MRGYASLGLLGHRILFHPNRKSGSFQLYNYGREVLGEPNSRSLCPGRGNLFSHWAMSPSGSCQSSNSRYSSANNRDRLSTLTKQAEHILHVLPVIFHNLLTFLTFYMPEPSPAALFILSTRGIWYWFLQQGGGVRWDILFLSLTESKPI
jgi:hypothetical protein